MPETICEHCLMLGALYPPVGCIDCERINAPTLAVRDRPLHTAGYVDALAALCLERELRDCRLIGPTAAAELRDLVYAEGPTP